MRKVHYVVLLFISATIIFISCKKESSDNTDKQELIPQNEKIAKAKTWFENKLPTMKLHYLYAEAKYDWAKAETYKFKDGYEIVTVPILNEQVAKAKSTGSRSSKDSVAGFLGREKLLLYPRMDGKGYLTKVLQVLPTANYLIAKNNKLKGKDFTGYVSVWNLETGFKRGLAFENGKRINPIIIRLDSIIKPTGRKQLHTQPAITNGRITANLIPNFVLLPEITITATRNSSPSGPDYMELTMQFGDLTLSQTLSGAPASNPSEYGGSTNYTLDDIASMMDEFGGNWYDGWVSGNVNSTKLIYILNRLGVTEYQFSWLSQNSEITNEIHSYLDRNLGSDADQIIMAHINQLTRQDDYSYVYFIQNYIGPNDPNHNLMWWENDVWLSNPNNFNLDISPDKNNEYDELTAAEKLLIKIYPIQAVRIRANKQKAIGEAQGLFGTGGLNDKHDAFRHAYFNALNTRDILPTSTLTRGEIVRLFGIAHESEVPSQLQLEKQMDLHNNDEGISLCGSCFFASDNNLANGVIDKLNNGSLWYLKPVEPTPPQGSNGINNDFWHINGDIRLGKHGITSDTHLTPTNQ